MISALQESAYQITWSVRPPARYPDVRRIQVSALRCAHLDSMWNGLTTLSDGLASLPKQCLALVNEPLKYNYDLKA